MYFSRINSLIPAPLIRLGPVWELSKGQKERCIAKYYTFLRAAMFVWHNRTVLVFFVRRLAFKARRYNSKVWSKRVQENMLSAPHALWEGSGTYFLRSQVSERACLDMRISIYLSICLFSSNMYASVQSNNRSKELTTETPFNKSYILFVVVYVAHYGNSYIFHLL